MATCTPAQERARRYAVGLVAAHLVLALAAVLLFVPEFHDYKWPRWQCIFLEALAFAQVGMVTAILAVGGLSIAYRVAAAAAVFMFWVIVLNALDFHHENWLTIFAIQTAGIGACLAVARIFGARLSCEPVPDVGSLERAKFCFSIRQMLLMTTAVSFLLCIGMVVTKLPPFQESMDNGGIPRAKSLGIVLAPVVLLAVWAAFGTTRRMTPFLLLIAVTLLAGHAVSRVDQIYRIAWWSTLTRESYQMAYLYLVFVYALVVCLSLAALRIGGFRMVRQSANS